MALAIVKISWRSSDRICEGGIAGSGFTLSTGRTITCAHVMDGLFTPNTGFENCRVFALASDGAISELFESDLNLHPQFDLAVVGYVQSSQHYEISDMRRDDVDVSDLIGFVANQAPFTAEFESDGRLTIISANPAVAAQNKLNTATEPCIINLSGNDLALKNIPGFRCQISAKVGLSGGPMIDKDGKVLGLCAAGLPRDVVDKTELMAVDLREPAVRSLLGF